MQKIGVFFQSLFGLFLLKPLSSDAQKNHQAIINNGFLSTQGWAGDLHPSGDYFVRADRTILHAYSTENGRLFQTFQSQCISDKIIFSADGKRMIVLTSGEMAENTCNRVIVFDFYSGEMLYNEQGKYVANFTNENVFYINFFNQDSQEFKIEKRDLADPNKLIAVLVDELAYQLDFADDQNLWVTKNNLIGTNESQDQLNVYDNEDFLRIKSIPMNTYLQVFDSEKNQLFFTSNAKDSIGILNLDDLTLHKNKLPFNSFFHYFYPKNDSIVCFINVTEQFTIAYNLTNNAIQKENFNLAVKKGDEPYRYKSTYIGRVHPINNALVHNNEFLLDFGHSKTTRFPVYVDSSLLHPCVVLIDPEHPEKLVINGMNWDYTSIKQFYQPKDDGYATTKSISNDDYLTASIPDAKLVEASFVPLLNHSQFFNYNLLSFPFSQGNDFVEIPQQVTKEYYQPSQGFTADWITQDKQIFLKIDDTTFLKGGQPIDKKILKANEVKAKKYINENYNGTVLRQLNNELPVFVLPVRFDYNELIEFEAKYQTALYYPFSLRESSNSNSLYEPIANEKVKSGSTGFVTNNTDDFEKVLAHYYDHLIKVAYLGYSGEQGPDYYMINTLASPTIPEISMTGIDPLIDIYCTDVIFPIPINRLLSMNYGTGLIKMLDRDKNLIVQSSFYKNEQFIHLTSEGYYFISKDVSNRISIREGNKVYPLEQFDLKYNRPDLVLKRMGCEDEQLIKALNQAYQRRLKKMGFTEDMLKDDFHLPQIQLKNKEHFPSDTDSSSIDLNLHLEDSKYPLERINVWVNDVAVFGTNGISLRDKSTMNLDTTVNLNLVKGMNKVQISVLNNSGAESYKESVDLECNVGKNKPNLYLVAIGVSEFQQTNYNLTYAAKDAMDLATLFKESAVYQEVYVKTLINEEVTKEKVIEAKILLENADINDHVIVFMAGHGVLSADLDYYLATCDMNFSAPEERGLSYETLEALLDGIKPLNKTLILDACHSGEIDKDDVQLAQNEQTEQGEVQFRVVGNSLQAKLGSQNTMELTKALFTDLRKGTGATVISSAGGMEFAMESGKWQNGLFTYVLLNGIKSGAADLNKDGEVWLSEIQQYVGETVSKLSNGQQQPTSRIENQLIDYRVW